MRGKEEGGGRGGGVRGKEEGRQEGVKRTRMLVIVMTYNQAYLCH